MNLLSTLIQKSSPRRFAVVGLHLDGQGDQQVFGVLKFKVSGGKLSHEAVDTSSFSSLDKLLKVLTGIPVVLQLEGPVVVHRERREALGRATHNDGERHEVFSAGEDFSVVTKKVLYQKVLEQAQDAGLELLDIGLGCSGLGQFKSLAGSKWVGHYHWGVVPRYEGEESSTIVVDNQESNTKKLSLWLRGVAWQSRSKTSPMHQEWFWKRILNNVLWIGLPVVLMVLVANFLVYQPLYNRVLEKETVTRSSAFMGWEQQKKAQEQRQALLRLNVQSELGKKSWYADQLIGVMPRGVSLTALEVFPLKGQVKAGKEIQIIKDQITVQGTANQGSELEGWIAAIESLQWTGECRLKQYDAQKGGAAFLLIISTKTDD